MLALLAAVVATLSVCRVRQRGFSCAGRDEAESEQLAERCRAYGGECTGQPYGPPVCR